MYSCRYVTSDLASDIIVSVGELKFYLHKFPLLWKSVLMQKLVQKAAEDGAEDITLPDIPGGAGAFEVCAKFSYGMMVILNAYNVAAVRCAAEYLEMTEDVEQGNLVFKIEVFLTSSILRSWKDSIIVLQSSQSLLPWSEDLKIIGRCLDSIASKTSVDPSNVHWSYTHNRKLALHDRIVEVGLRSHEGVEPVPKDWWVEDVSELEIGLFKRLITAVKSKGRMDGSVIAEALKTYAIRWLPDTIEDMVSEDHVSRNKALLETILALLPSGSGCTCAFLLKLLHISILVRADEDIREDLMSRVSMKLDEASVNDLLIPSRCPESHESTVYDVELVQSILRRFIAMQTVNQGVDIVEKGAGLIGEGIGHRSLLSVAKLIDGYLAKVAHDQNLTLFSFIDLALMVPESARLTHDGLYMAVDTFLKVHPNMAKAERKRLCELVDVKKLTEEASMHAAQNDKLPLRLVVQVLFFEQVRAVQSLKAARSDTSQSVTNTTDEEPERTSSLRHQLSKMILNEGDAGIQISAKLLRKNSRSHSGAQLLPSRSRRIFSKIWNVGKKKSSVTSGSSQSPTSMVVGETKSSGSSSRHRRHSIS
uniref:Phototropic-responsive NPH3 family protein n=1 Tax=Kalanchoe fedtschenkoi TaxID=63787 RepID=A0A7N0U7H9_KALFE